MLDSLAALAQFVSRTLAPLTTALTSNDLLAEYTERLGWTLPAVPHALTDLRSSTDALVSSLSTLEDLLRRELDGVAVEDAVTQAATQFLLDLAKVAADVRALPAGLRDQLPQAFLDGSHIAEQLVQRVFSDAITRKIEREQPGLYQFTRVLGFIEVIEHQADAARFQPAYVERAIRWDRFAMLASGPGALMADVYAWGTQNLDTTRLLLTLRDWAFATQSPVFFDYAKPQLLAAFAPDVPAGGVPRRGIGIPLLPGSPLSVVLGIHPLPPVGTGAQGVAVTLTGAGAVERSIDIAPSLRLELEGSIELSSGLAFAVWPDRPPRLIGASNTDTPGPIADGNLTIRLRYAPADSTQRVSLLSFDGLTLDAKGTVLEASFSAASDHSVEFRAQASLPGVRLAVNHLGQDSFLSDILPDDISIELDLSVGWSLKRGLYWQTGGGPKFQIPISRNIGPVRLDALELSFQAPDDTYEFSAGVSAATRLGPISAEVQGVGFAVTIDPQGGNVGPIGIGASVAPPRGVGLSIDAQGVVTGGGFLQYDPAQGLYAGALQLSLHDELTLSAYGIIATRLPDGRPGYSLLVFITAEDFEPIPLGFGFMLASIGGMLGVNRTFDESVLRAGLKSDLLGTLLFPRDPVGNAPALLRALGSAFPAKRGSILLGLLARITWFTPTLVTLDLGLILEIGARTRLLVLGRVSALLPSVDNDLIRLVLDAMGVLDFDAGTLAIDAVLVDSRLVHRFPITGAAAVRARWGRGGGGDAASGSSFVLAVGGFHPRFAVPAGFPTLERTAIALTAGNSPRLVCEAYFAITSNTAQFGARASLYAEAGGFSLAGDVGFDALVSFAPFHFLVDFHATVQLKRGSHNLFRLSLDGTLEGPLPLRLRGKVTFEILWVSFTVRVDATLVSGDAAQNALAAVALKAEIEKALANPASWRAQRASDVAHGVSLRPAATNGGPVLDPLGELVVTQQVAPLNLERDVDTFGGAPVAGDRRFALSGMLNTTAGTPVQGAFAPARYFTLSDDDKLTAPSFEPMDAGLRLGDVTVRYAGSSNAVVPAPLEYAPITLNPVGAPAAPAPSEAPRYAMPVESVAQHAPTGAAARARVREVARSRFRAATTVPAVMVAPPRWAVVRANDGAVQSTSAPSFATDTPGGPSWTEQRAALERLNRGGASWLMVPTHEL